MCTGCGRSVSGRTRDDTGRDRDRAGRSKRHRPVDEGPPSNPVIDPELARRLLDDLGG